MKNKELISNNEENKKDEVASKIIKPSDKRNKSLKMVSISSAILFIAIVIIFNIVFESLFGANLKWDWTQTDMYTLGDVSKEILNNLEDDITIIGLYKKGTVDNFKDVEVFLDEYVKASNGKVTVSYIDPTETPSILTDLDPEQPSGPRAGDICGPLRQE